MLNIRFFIKYFLILKSFQTLKTLLIFTCNLEIQLLKKYTCMKVSLFQFLSIILTGLLAGTSFGIFIGLNPYHYGAVTYIEQQQNLVKSLNALMIGLVLCATFITILSAYHQRHNKRLFAMLLLAVALLLSCIIITRLGNIPIQNEIRNWSATSYPDNWTDLRNAWWNYHIARTIVELTAFLLVTYVAVAKVLTKNKIDG